VVNPPIAATTGGQATTTLTGGPVGPCQASTTVDNETVSLALEVLPFPVVAIPTMSTVGLALLVLTLAGLALFRLRGAAERVST